MTGSGFVPGNPPITSWTPPIIAGLPPAPPNNCAGGVDFVVPKNGSATIPPGAYNNIDIKDGSTATLQAGNYFLCGDLSIGKNTTTNTVTGIVMNIAGRVGIGNGSVFGPADDLKMWINGTGTPTLGKNSEIHAHMIAPSSTINLGDNNNLFGQFWAKELNADKNTNVTGPEVPCQ